VGLSEGFSREVSRGEQQSPFYASNHPRHDGYMWKGIHKA